MSWIRYHELCAPRSILFQYAEETIFSYERIFVFFMQHSIKKKKKDCSCWVQFTLLFTGNDEKQTF